MENNEHLLTADERAVLEKLAKQPDIEGQRAAALLAIDEGATQAAAAEQSGLTKGQVQYISKEIPVRTSSRFPGWSGAVCPPMPRKIRMKTTPPVEQSIVEQEVPDLSTSQIGRLVKRA